MKIEATVQCPVFDSFRVQQVAGMFDLPVEKKSRETFAAELPGVDEVWSVGLIVGPSGSGKSTVAREAFGQKVYGGGEWAADKAVIDGFDAEIGIREITSSLTAVGLSSPPSWVKPYAVLSNGEKFRCDLARALMGNGDVVVFDEFTSVVDRTVAKIGSAAVSKAIRSGRINKRFVAVSCHYDIAEWLEPDWVLDMASRTLSRGRLRRPEIKLEVRRCGTEVWQLFRRAHYLSSDLHKGSKCFVGLVDGCPAVFTAVLSFPHPVRPAWREHRTVCLPDFQGIGLGNRMSELVAGIFRATGKPYISTTSHPAMMRYRAKSSSWKMNRKPSRISRTTSRATGMAASDSATRVTAGFEYVGPARHEQAKGFGITGQPETASASPSPARAALAGGRR